MHFRLLVVSFLFLALYAHSSEAMATMAIDLGSEFIKVAIVKPGVPMEIALDGESSRKTPTVVTIRDGERMFGGAAVNMGVKFPAMSYQYIPTLIGKSSKDAEVQQFLKNFPYYKVTDDEKNGQLVFHHDDDTKYTAEELLAMLLEKAKETAEKYSGFPIKSAVITVPPFYTQAARRALIRAASLCELSVLQLMSHNTAVALNYGVFRFKTFNATAQHLLFYDLGATAATATLVEYRTVMHKEHGMAEETPQLTILGVGYDKQLGTVALALRLRDYLATKFNEMGKAPKGKDVRENPRAMAKLFRESMRVLKVLSANQQTMAQVENVMDDVDLKVPVSRSTFEEITADLLARVNKPIHQAVSMAQLPMAFVKEVILMGGGTRIPKVQEVLLKATDKSDLGKGINSDEAAALGAVYQAAHLSPGFRVKRFLVKDANLFPIQVSFPRASSAGGEEQQEAPKLVTRTIFRLQNQFPLKKALTFNKHMHDFSFYVHLGEMEHLNEEQANEVTKNLSTVHLKGVDAVFKKHLPTTEPSPTEVKVESKGIKAHFELNSNGIFQLVSVEALFEKTKPVAPTINVTVEEQSNLEKSQDDKKPPASAEEKSDTKTAEGSEKTSETKSSSGTEDKEKPETSSGNTTEKNVTKTTTPPPPPKPEIVSEAIDFVLVQHDAPVPSEKYKKTSTAKIRKLREKDEEKRALEKSRNELEAYIFEMRDRLTRDEYEKTSTEEERDSLTAVLMEVSDWYDESGVDTLKTDFDTKLVTLKKAMRDVEERVRELRERPKAFSRLLDLLNSTRIVHESMLNFTGENQVFTATEMNLLGKLMNETQDWMLAKQEEVKTMILSKKPTVLVEDINMKSAALQREIQYLLNKIEIWKANPPKPPKKEETEKNKTATDEGTKTSSEEKQTPEEPKTPEEPTAPEEPTTSSTTKEEEQEKKSGSPHTDL